MNKFWLIFSLSVTGYITLLAWNDEWIASEPFIVFACVVIMLASLVIYDFLSDKNKGVK